MDNSIENIKNVVIQTGLKHVAIIMDGNRRWAKEKGFPSAVGHQQGVKALKNVVTACNDFGVKFLTVYAFSTENFNRKPEEVSFLLNLVASTIADEIIELHDKNVRITFLGNLNVLPQNLRIIFQNAETKTQNNSGVNLQIAFNYGSHAEIINAVKSIASKVQVGTVSINQIDEKLIENELYTKNLPHPDLLIRTGGDFRVSNFLLWQIAYSEILIVPTFWPDFSQIQLAYSILEFQNRNRRFGK